MEKERILSEIKTRIGDPSVKDKFSNISERTLSEYVDKMLIPADDQINDAFYASHVGILETVAGNIRHSASSAVEEFKKNYKPEPTPQHTLTPTPQPTPANDVETRLKAFEDWQKKQEEEKANSVKTAAIKAKTTEVLQKLKDQGASNEVILELVEKNLTVKEDCDAEILLKEAKAIYEDRNTKLFGEGYNPAQGSTFQARQVSPAECQKAIAENQKKYRENLQV